MKRLLLNLVVALISVSPLVAQDSTINESPASTDRPYRDPQRARTLAMILPGAGHVYSGEYLQAYGYWVGTAVGISVGVEYLTSHAVSRRSCKSVGGSGGHASRALRWYLWASTRGYEVCVTPRELRSGQTPGMQSAIEGSRR